MKGKFPPGSKWRQFASITPYVVGPGRWAKMGPRTHDHNFVKYETIKKNFTGKFVGKWILKIPLYQRRNSHPGSPGAPGGPPRAGGPRPGQGKNLIFCLLFV